jgi:hypothetical protein
MGADPRESELVDQASRQDEEAVDLGEDAHTDPDASPPSPKSGLEAWPARWRMAEALETLRRQINAMAPDRDRASDGGIGDRAHQNSTSDHNPWVMDGPVGVVTARDFTHSPATGCDAGVLVEVLRASRDPRIKYMIWNRRVCAGTPRGGQPAWAWRPYTGKNPHTRHAHVSVMPSKALYDDSRPFALGPLGAGGAGPSRP